MLLTADIGNTSITLGLFEEDALVEDTDWHQIKIYLWKNMKFF